MKNHASMLPLALVTLVLLVAGCATDSDVPSLYVGMSRDRLKARFGEPVRIERASAGGEDWYYPFSNPPEFQATSEHDVPSNSDSASVTISSGAGTRERAVHLSPDGYVVEPLPRGHLAR